MMTTFSGVSYSTPTGDNVLVVCVIRFRFCVDEFQRRGGQEREGGQGNQYDLPGVVPAIEEEEEVILLDEVEVGGEIQEEEIQEEMD